MSALFSKKLYMTSSRQTNLDLARGRIVLVGFVFLLAYSVVAVRAFDVSVIQSMQTGVEAEEMTGMSVSPFSGAQMSSLRGDIVDRNGVLLARSVKTASLYADPAMIADPAAVAEKLTTVLPDSDYATLFKKLQSKGRFVWLARAMTPAQQQAVLYLGEPGLGFKEETKRLYPQGRLTAHVVGYTNIDGHGIAGLESSFDDYLSEHHADAPLQLSLDVRLQHALRREISAAVKKHSAIGGAGLIMDVKSGAVLASVSYPDYDPVHASTEKDARLFNRVTLGVYEPGSTFKILTTAKFLEEGGSVAKIYDTREPIRVGRFTINDYHAQKRKMYVPEVFMHSSNIGTAMMAQDIGTQPLKEFYRTLGFFDRPDLDVPEVGQAIVPSPWREVNTLTASYGHGIAVSPLQLAGAVASIINEGVVVRPTYLLSEFLLSESGHNMPAEKHEQRIVSPETSEKVRQMMRLVVTDGTGRKGDVDGFYLGGKTGTADKIGRHGYDKNKRVASFIAAFPMQDPRYLIYVMVDEPKGIKETYNYATGGWVAAPVVARTVQSMAAVLGLVPDQSAGDIVQALYPYVKTEEQLRKEAAHASR